jgi:hypothetical protein
MQLAAASAGPTRFHSFGAKLVQFGVAPGYADAYFQEKFTLLPRSHKADATRRGRPA